MTNEELLEEAKRRYPIGTVYHPIEPDGTIGCYKNQVHESKYPPNIIHLYNITIECGVGYIYANGKWAEIVSLPENKEVVPEYVECIGLKKGDYNWQNHFEIGKIYEISRINSSGSYVVKYSNVESSIVPNDQFKPSTKEAFDAQNVPRYVECIRNNGNEFTKGKIYEVGGTRDEVIQVKLDDRGSRSNGWHKKFFKPSTKEAFDAQPKNMFLKDEYIVFTNSPQNGNFPINHVFKQRSNKTYLNPYLDIQGSTTNGWEYYRNFDKNYKGVINDWRYATQTEIDKYEELGRPFDINILNQSKTIEKWSVGSYIVPLQNKLLSRNETLTAFKPYVIVEGLIPYIICDKGVKINFCVRDCDAEKREGIKWFATKSEAEEFAKTLVEPIKEQPSKQAVHCKTQEEWDFVTEKLGYKWNSAKWIDYKEFSKIGLNEKCYGKSFDEYQILSFQEWCDLNGYKMKTKKSTDDLITRAVKSDNPNLIAEELGYTIQEILDSYNGEKSNCCTNAFNKLKGFKCHGLGCFEDKCPFNKNISKAKEWLQSTTPKPKEKKENGFEVGKWYKYHGWYIKYLKHNDGIWVSSENISPDCIYDKIESNFGGDSNKTLASIEEIQQYLPDGHPDKIKSEVTVGDLVNLHASLRYNTTKEKFKVGDFVQITKSTRNWTQAMDKFDGKIVQITGVDGDQIWFDGHEYWSFNYSDGHFKLMNTLVVSDISESSLSNYTTISSLGYIPVIKDWPPFPNTLQDVATRWKDMPPIPIKESKYPKLLDETIKLNYLTEPE